MFTEPLAAKILRGGKTATRRRLSDKPRSPWFRGNAIGAARYPVGKVFTVNPGRGVGRVAECKVTGRYRAVLGALDDTIARQEGFDTMVSFRGAWRKINGEFDGSELVDVVEFQLDGPYCRGCDGCGWCEGSPAWTCTDCGGTGRERNAAARDLLARNPA
jgi:hypothetical protein